MKKGSHLKQFYDEKLEIKTRIMKALGSILNDPKIKGDYENYIKACEDYSLLNGNKEDNSDLKDMANEIISTVNYNIALKRDEIDQLSVMIRDNIKTMEDKFLPVLNDCNENNIEFKNALTRVSEAKDDIIYDIKDESEGVDTCVSKALDVVLNNPQIKVHYETYKQNCTKYSVLTCADKL